MNLRRFKYFLRAQASCSFALFQRPGNSPNRGKMPRNFRRMAPAGRCSLQFVLLERPKSTKRPPGVAFPRTPKRQRSRRLQFGQQYLATCPNCLTPAGSKVTGQVKGQRQRQGSKARVKGKVKGRGKVKVKAGGKVGSGHTALFKKPLFCVFPRRRRGKTPE